MSAKVIARDPPPPGPGWYDPSLAHKPAHPSFSFRAKHNHTVHGKDYKDPPGPCEYHSEYYKRIITEKDLPEGKRKNLKGASLAGKVDQGSVDDPPECCKYFRSVNDPKAPKFDLDIACTCVTAPAFSLGYKRSVTDTHCEVFAKQKATDAEVGPGKYLKDNCCEGSFKANYRHETHLPMLSVSGRDYVKCMKDFAPGCERYHAEYYKRIITEKDLPEGKKKGLKGATFSGRIWEGAAEFKPAFYK